MTYDPYSRATQEDPYPGYRHFVEDEPCAHNAEHDFYALFRFEDVWDAILDWQTYSSRLGPPLENREVPGDFASILGMDPPRQKRLRNLVSRGFTPARIAGLEPEVRRLARGYLDRLAEDGGGEFQDAVANRLPMDVISLVLGIPAEDRDAYRRWVARGLERDPDTGLPYPDGVEGMQKSREYILGLMAERRARPRDDLMSVIAHSEYADLDGETKPLTEAEAASFSTLLGAAGSDTTTKLLGNCMVYLARHPDVRERLWADPAAIPGAVEELLRYDTPTQYVGRVMNREVTMHGVTIPQDARVALVLGAANRDPREFDRPDVLDIDRRPERQIVFGFGQHVCLGKTLARLEARVVLEEVCARFPHYTVEESGLSRTYQAHVRGFATVPISC